LSGVAAASQGDVVAHCRAGLGTAYFFTGQALGLRNSFHYLLLSCRECPLNETALKSSEEQ
jgi:hypothetical protein